MIADRPVVALTMGDVAGIGPEVIARAWGEPHLRSLASPIVIGNASVLRSALRTIGSNARVVSIASPEDANPTELEIPCLDPTGDSLEGVRIGHVDPRAGRAAYEFLVSAIDLALAGRIDAITTLPLNKESLAAAGIQHPGHTEILAERCGTPDHAMMLYLPSREPDGAGLGVIHATLHVAFRRVIELLTFDAILEKILLADRSLRALNNGKAPRVAVAGLNPHAGENGLFGDEEILIIGPAVAKAKTMGVNVTGPIAADTLFARAFAGEFDAVVAMYHDQGHVALKTMGFDRAVNVTLGLPIVRTSVAHGTAFDIAGLGIAQTSSLIEAVRVAARLVAGRAF